MWDQDLMTELRPVPTLATIRRLICECCQGKSISKVNEKKRAQHISKAKKFEGFPSV
ncbi:hypothetical protein JHK85_017405 [Glycine max]|nr:hypothetical protein JHK85_017405 [Glycine max]